MGLESIIYTMVGASILGIGIAVGGIIEYKLATRKLADRDSIYHHNIEEIARVLYLLEDRIKIIHIRVSHVTEEIREIKEKLEDYDPIATQEIDMRNRKKENHTPSMPYQDSCNSGSERPGW
tara:strand:- start:4328 stop:4693 length:366 start_codon:yes stop_codon:yes gene_type:complete